MGQNRTQPLKMSRISAIFPSKVWKQCRECRERLNRTFLNLCLKSLSFPQFFFSENIQTAPCWHFAKGWTSTKSHEWDYFRVSTTAVWSIPDWRTMRNFGKAWCGGVPCAGSPRQESAENIGAHGSARGCCSPCKYRRGSRISVRGGPNSGLRGPKTLIWPNLG